jgi:hypothetical protein
MVLEFIMGALLGATQPVPKPVQQETIERYAYQDTRRKSRGGIYLAPNMELPPTVFLGKNIRFYGINAQSGAYQQRSTYQSPEQKRISTPDRQWL